jgi:hypothetical protein
VDVGVTDCNRKIALIKTVIHTDKSRLGLDATVAHFDKLFGALEHTHSLITHSQRDTLNSIQGALLAWETYVNITKASEVDNIQK